MRTTENRRARMRCGRNTFRVYYPFDYRFEALFVLVLAPSLSPSQLWLCLWLWTSSSVGRSSSSFAHFECQTRRKFTQVIYICSLSVIFTIFFLAYARFFIGGCCRCWKYTCINTYLACSFRFRAIIAVVVARDPCCCVVRCANVRFIPIHNCHCSHRTAEFFFYSILF